MTLDDFRDLVESLGGTVTADRVYVADRADWPIQHQWPCVRVDMNDRPGRERFRTVTAPTYRACCAELLPWVKAQADWMEARS